jgi:hypothetical protein
VAFCAPVPFAEHRLHPSNPTATIVSGLRVVGCHGTSQQARHTGSGSGSFLALNGSEITW